MLLHYEDYLNCSVLCLNHSLCTLLCIHTWAKQFLQMTWFRFLLSFVADSWLRPVFWCFCVFWLLCSRLTEKTDSRIEPLHASDSFVYTCHSSILVVVNVPLNANSRLTTVSECTVDGVWCRTVRQCCGTWMKGNTCTLLMEVVRPSMPFVSVQTATGSAQQLDQALRSGFVLFVIVSCSFVEWQNVANFNAFCKFDKAFYTFCTKKILTLKHIYICGVIILIWNLVLGGNVQSFVCWFWCYINCMFVYLLNFLCHFLLSLCFLCDVFTSLHVYLCTCLSTFSRIGPYPFPGWRL